MRLPITVVAGTLWLYGLYGCAGSEPRPVAPAPVRAATPALNPQALAELERRAKETDSNALIVIKNGQVVVEDYFGKPPHPMELMSVTKAIVSLAIGMLIDDGKIAGLDAPLSTWFPEWKDGDKAKVTLRHVMTHTSGLSHKRWAEELNGQDDRLTYARNLPLAGEPGKTFEYNNEAVELLSGVIAQAAGKPVDAFLDERLFSPLGIKDWHWNRDRAGNVVTYAELSLLPRDLARIGQLLIEGGRAGNRQLVSRAWLEQSTRPALGGEVGLLWFMQYDHWDVYHTAAGRDALRTAGFAAADKLAPLDDKKFKSAEEYRQAIRKLMNDDELRQLEQLLQQRPELEHFVELRPGNLIGFSHDGSLGQFLVIQPERGLVVVRMREEANVPSTLADYQAVEKQHGMDDLYDLVVKLVPETKI